MRYAVIILFLLVFVACRTHKEASRLYEENTQLATTDQLTRKDSTKIEHVFSDTTSLVIHTEECIRITDYRDDGSILRVSEHRRQTRQAQMAVSLGRTSEVSVSEEQQTSRQEYTTDITGKEFEETHLDTRVIQGSEWIAIIAGIAVVILIFIALVIYKKTKAKK